MMRVWYYRPKNLKDPRSKKKNLYNIEKKKKKQQQKNTTLKSDYFL